MTLREMIYDIKEMFNVYSDDSSLSDEHIAFLIKTKRNAFLKNYISNLKKEIPLEAKQLICLELQEDDMCEDDFKFLRSVHPIPATIETTGRTNIAEAYLGSRVAKWLNIIDYPRLPYLKGGRYNEKQIYITIDPNNYVVVYSRSNNHELLESIKLNIVPEDPEEADKFACSDNPEEDKCDFYDKKFPVESSMANEILKEIKNELLLKYKVPSDTINNGEDDLLNKGSNGARQQ